MHKTKAQLKNSILPGISLIFILVAWQLIDYLFKIKEVVLPNPSEIFSAAYGNSLLLLKHTGITMIESILGFMIGTTFAILIALIFIYSLPLKKIFYPYAIALKATPLYALAPLLVLWFGNGIWSKVVMSAMIAFFPVLVNAVKGFTAVEQESLDLFKSLSASKMQILFKLRFPNALPYIFPALKIATTLSVVGATIAEFTGASYGIGHVIVNSSYYLETSMMFAAILMISLGGVIFFGSIALLEKKIIFWQRHE